YSDPVAAARHICFTAALYADIQESLGRQHWSYAYSDFMLRRYEYIHRFSQVLAILIGMHETPSNPPLSHIL
ncbi:MAG: hypothetical protein LBN38_08510, partial [Verrucomicrobiota bacterium]|nr:hypothetical protein [Verrucomicrobiota bacterium]